jgi:hypothetical protein
MMIRTDIQPGLDKSLLKTKTKHGGLSVSICIRALFNCLNNGDLNE